MISPFLVVVDVRAQLDLRIGLWARLMGEMLEAEQESHGDDGSESGRYAQGLELWVTCGSIVWRWDPLTAVLPVPCFSARRSSRQQGGESHALPPVCDVVPLS